MSYKYSKIRSIESIRDGIQYMVTKFVTSDDTDEIPVVGVLADWTPTTSYVIGVEKVPDSQHSIYKITAKDVSDILEETDFTRVHTPGDEISSYLVFNVMNFSIGRVQ